MATKTKPKPAPKAKPATAAKRSKPAANKPRQPRAKVTPGVLIPIQTFAPEPYELKRPILAVVRPYDHEYTATFPDAVLTTYGDDEWKAVENLKLMIIYMYDILSKPGLPLAPPLEKQLAVLRDFIIKRGA